MATKAELEEELKRLKEELAALRTGDTAQAVTEKASEIGDTVQDGTDTILETVGELTQELANGIEEMPAQKTLLVAAGAFFLGYFLGHSMRR